MWEKIKNAFKWIADHTGISWIARKISSGWKWLFGGKKGNDNQQSVPKQPDNGKSNGMNGPDYRGIPNNSDFINKISENLKKEAKDLESKVNQGGNGQADNKSENTPKTPVGDDVNQPSDKDSPTPIPTTNNANQPPKVLDLSKLNSETTDFIETFKANIGKELRLSVDHDDLRREINKICEGQPFPHTISMLIKIDKKDECVITVSRKSASTMFVQSILKKENGKYLSNNMISVEGNIEHVKKTLGLSGEESKVEVIVSKDLFLGKIPEQQSSINANQSNISQSSRNNEPDQEDNQPKTPSVDANQQTIDSNSAEQVNGQGGLTNGEITPNHLKITDNSLNLVLTKEAFEECKTYENPHNKNEVLVYISCNGSEYRITGVPSDIDGIYKVDINSIAKVKDGVVNDKTIVSPANNMAGVKRMLNVSCEESIAVTNFSSEPSKKDKIVVLTNNKIGKKLVASGNLSEPTDFQGSPPTSETLLKQVENGRKLSYTPQLSEFLRKEAKKDLGRIITFDKVVPSSSFTSTKTESPVDSRQP